MRHARSQDDFVVARQKDWRELDQLLGDKDTLSSTDGAEISRVAQLYRSLCNDVMRARSAGYAPDLGAYLDGLAGRAHNAVYGAEPFRLPGVVAFFTRDFPRALRRNAAFFALAWALLLVPWIIGLVGAMSGTGFAEKVLPSEALEGMADAYSKGFDAGRDVGTDTGMAGFYVYNNIGIAFRCFATGALFGVGSLFFLIYNGLLIGTVTGHVASVGHGGNILTFMCGHGPFEITAIVISGAAGLRMGYALVATGGLTRTGSLRRAAPDLARMILGAAAMLAIAALIEGFWSPSSLPAPVKWAASALFSLGVTLYLALAGRAGDGARA